jgi:predicted dehydrogenase
MIRPRFGVVGFGSIGKRHVRNLLALDEKNVLVFDPRADRRAEAEALGVSTTAALEILLDVRPEAVLVTSPSKMHVAHALAAAERGCHLFIEKPVADEHIDALDQLIATVARQSLTTLVGCNLRFHPALVRAKELLGRGRVGRICSARAEFGQYLPDWHPWEDYRQGYSARKDLGGGVILDAIHEIDYVRWLLGEVTSVAALAGHLSHLEIDTEDTASILLRFESGAFGEVHLDYVQRTYTRSCQIVGDEGTLAWAFGDGGKVRLFEARTKAWEELPPREGWEPNAMYVDEMRHFLACLRGEERPQQDIAEAMRVLDLALAAKKSAAGSIFVAPGRNQPSGEPA